MAPPAKRQKRLVVLSSDDEEPNVKQTHKPIPTRSRAKSTKNNTGRSRLATQPGPDPLLKDNAAKISSAGTVQTMRPISSFFGVGTQAQQRNGQKSLEIVPPEVEDHEDLIVDDSPVEDENDPGGTSTRTTLDRRKNHQAPAKDNAPATNKPTRFKISEHPSSMGISPGISGEKKAGPSAIDMKPWAQKFGPNNLEELMVHRKKVSDVRDWLKNVLRGQARQRLLILKGPSGAGKTATISMLAKAMNFDVLEWQNPVGAEFSSEAYLSMSAHFEDFLARSGKFNELALADCNRNVSATPSPTINALNEGTRERIILIEEFPNTFLSTSSALRSFQSSVLQYLAFNTPSMGAFLSKHQGNNSTVAAPPVVMVITETRLTTTTAASDSFTAHRLLGPEILSHPAVCTIEFNPMASTYLTKALDLVVRKEARQSGRHRVPRPALLKKLSEVGDIRSAIGSLEFLCLRGEDKDDWSGRVASKAKTGANALTRMETQSLAIVAQRESALGLFHAVSRVVYNKRDDFADSDAASVRPAQPPSYLSQHARLRTAQVSTNQLIDETGTDIATFIAALHENFVLSCDGNSFSDNFEGCIDALSDSDILGSPRGGRFGSPRDLGNRPFQGASSDILRQDEICFNVAVLGLLFALPDPVKRHTHPVSRNSEGKNDTHRMFYPTSMRLSRQVEEIDGLIGQWTDRLRASAVPVGKSMGKDVRHFTPLPSRRGKPHSKVTGSHRSQSDEDDQEPSWTSLGGTKSELVIESLPYITKIEQSKAASTHLNGLERITQFHGINRPGNNESDHVELGEEASVTDWMTDGPAKCNVVGPAPKYSLQQNFEQAGKATSTLVLPLEEEVGQLYLSDDDIEDY